MPGTNKSTTPDGERDEWRTQEALYELLDQEFRFQIDVAATAENALCPLFYTEQDNGLEQPWFYHDTDDKRIERAWCNPPFSLASEFLQKGRAEVKRSGLQEPVAVFLLRADAPETQWWTNGVLNKRFAAGPYLYQPAFQIRYLIARTNYRTPWGDPAKNVNFPSAVVIMGKYAPGAYWWDWRTEAVQRGIEL